MPEYQYEVNLPPHLRLDGTDAEIREQNYNRILAIDKSLQNQGLLRKGQSRQIIPSNGKLLFTVKDETTAVKILDYLKKQGIDVSNPMRMDTDRLVYQKFDYQAHLPSTRASPSPPSPSPIAPPATATRAQKPPTPYQPVPETKFAGKPRHKAKLSTSEDDSGYISETFINELCDNDALIKLYKENIAGSLNPELKGFISKLFGNEPLISKGEVEEFIRQYEKLSQANPNVLSVLRESVSDKALINSYRDELCDLPELSALYIEIKNKRNLNPLGLDSDNAKTVNHAILKIYSDDVISHSDLKTLANHLISTQLSDSSRQVLEKYATVPEDKLFKASASDELWELHTSLKNSNHPGLNLAENAHLKDTLAKLFENKLVGVAEFRVASNLVQRLYPGNPKVEQCFTVALKTPVSASAEQPDITGFKQRYRKVLPAEEQEAPDATITSPSPSPRR